MKGRKVGKLVAQTCADQEKSCFLTVPASDAQNIQHLPPINRIASLENVETGRSSFTTAHAVSAPSMHEHSPRAGAVGMRVTPERKCCQMAGVKHVLHILVLGATRPPAPQSHAPQVSTCCRMAHAGSVNHTPQYPEMGENVFELDVEPMKD